ncbi:hypothetical protein HPB47_028279 [Ixodes persulcatus]|uniref:Uncharacterized protein n=1 Tax=Ixodes persulcatus TaxID=34615 RepID=A0AC60PU75_IXOPE|nr:hypothetical protein HPB47_028279 [Ixodes persulcatus]
MTTSNGMGDSDQAQVEMTSFRVADFSDILDWRPMLFQEPLIARRACVLCGVVYKKAIRLPCLHSMCVKCHALCVEQGSACPVDQEPFSEDDVEQLEASLNYILKRNKCDFSIVPCCRCRSSVLRSDVLEHFKSGCSIPEVTWKPMNNCATLDLKDINTAFLDVKRVMEKISEDLVSMQTSLNQCTKGVKAEDARCKGLWELEASKLTEQLKDLSTVCTTGFTEELQVLQTAMTDYKEHLSQELGLQRDKLSVVSDAVSQCLLSHCKPKRVHWYIDRWSDLKALASDLMPFSSPPRSMFDYTVSQVVSLECRDDVLKIGCFMQILPGDHDSQLEWPFRKVFTVGVIHPKDQSNVISVKLNPSDCEVKYQTCFQRPKGGKMNDEYGEPSLVALNRLVNDGFLQNNTLHLFLEIEP